MSIDLSSFNATVSSFSKNVEKDVSRLQRTIAFDLLGGIVKRTPVDTGRARGNWQISIGTPATGILDRKLTKRNQTNVEEQAKISPSNLPPFSVIWLTNNLPYIEVLEFGKFVPKNPGPSKDPRPKRKGKVWVKDGFSVQAPQGMVRVTLAEIEAALSNY